MRNPTNTRRAFPVLAMLALTFALPATAADGDAPRVTADTRLAILGDSITEQKQYSKFIELYVTACATPAAASVHNFGWGGESAPHFANRMAGDVMPWMPTLMTVCYGMNDGAYRAYTDQVGEKYRNGMRKILEQAKQVNVPVLVGGPGAVDTATFKRTATTPAVYNETLSKLNDIAKELAEEFGMPHVDVHGACIDAMAKAKAALGDAHPIMGGDGVHPNENGQLVMAYAFLKAMGFDGDLGTITLDLADPAASAGTGGHTVAAAENGTFTVTSTRYPFCMNANKNRQGALDMAPFVPFNADLNRMTLVVKNPGAENAVVAWGKAERTFTAAQLAEGVNLADAFAGETPFQQAWQALSKAVNDKQTRETWKYKTFMNLLRPFAARHADDAEFMAAFAVVVGKVDQERAAHEDRIRAAVTPVEHALAVTPVNAE